MAVNMKDVALAADVSTSTVSRILKGTSRASADTYDKVSRIAESLKYRPNIVAKGVFSGKTQSVGVLLPAFNPFFGEIMRGIHDFLIKKEYLPLTIWPDYSKHDGPTELEQIHRLIQRRVDGVILVPLEEAKSDQYFKEILDQNLPLVTVDRQLPIDVAAFVGIDDFAGSRMVADYLLGLGHRNFAHLAGSSETSTGKLRRRGFESRILECNDAHCITAETAWSDVDVEPVLKLIDRKNRPTAIFAANDEKAEVVYKAANRLGLRIPEDLSVVGFGNLWFASRLNPPMTTVNQFPYDIGVKAAESMLSWIENPEVKPVPVLLNPTLIERESVKSCL